MKNKKFVPLFYENQLVYGCLLKLKKWGFWQNNKLKKIESGIVIFLGTYNKTRDLIYISFFYNNQRFTTYINYKDELDGRIKIANI